MLSFAISDSLIVIMEAYLLRCQESKTSDFDVVFLCEADKVCAVLFLWVSVVDNNAVAFKDLLLGHFVALLFSFQRVTVYSGIF